MRLPHPSHRPHCPEGRAGGNRLPCQGQVGRWQALQGPTGAGGAGRSTAGLRARADIPGPSGCVVHMCEPLRSGEPGTRTGARVGRGRVAGRVVCGQEACASLQVPAFPNAQGPPEPWQGGIWTSWKSRGRWVRCKLLPNKGPLGTLTDFWRSCGHHPASWSHCGL